MNELGIFDLMLPAFAECLVLVGIHSYLGLHVIKRKVIFVDLALAQVAALGTTVGFIFGMAPDSVAALIFSILFTFFAAAVFSLVRLRSDQVPQEAIIGLVYAVTAALIILVIDRAPHGAEHIKEVMTGALLWVQWESIIFAAVVYSAVGAFHWLFRKRFLLISHDVESAYCQGINVRLWDFLFYMSFGVVISISVRTAGVLLVFVFLIVPAIAATLITSRLRLQLVIGWTLGVVVTVSGLGISYLADTPSGPTVVGLYGAALVVVAVAVYLWRQRTPAALGHVLAGVGVGAAALILVLGGGRLLGGSSLAAGRNHQHAEAVHGPHVHDEASAHDHDEAHPHDHDGHHLPVALEVGAQPGQAEKPGAADSVAAVLAALDAAAPDARPALLATHQARGTAFFEKLFEQSRDTELRIAIGRQLCGADAEAAGASLLLQLLREAEFPFLRSEIATELEQVAGRKFGFDPEVDPAKNSAALALIESWIASLSPPT